MDFTPTLIAATFGTYLLAGTVKGVIGLGLPSIAIALMVLLLAPAHAAALLILPSLVTNIWQMLVGPHLLALLRRFWLLLLLSVAGIWIGGGVLTSNNSRLAAFGLGVALAAYGLLGLSGVRFHVAPRWQCWLDGPVGLATGLVAGATGVFVLPAGLYFQAIGLTKDELVQMLGLSFTVSTIALAAVLFRDGVMDGGNLAASAMATIPALLGVVLGQRIRHRASPETFRRLFFGGLLLLGLQQAIRHLF